MNIFDLCIIEVLLLEEEYKTLSEYISCYNFGDAPTVVAPWLLAYIML